MDKKDKRNLGEGDKPIGDDDQTHTFDNDQTVTSGNVSNNTKQTLANAPTITGYKILSILGKGGMGVVYEAEQQNPKRKVALKVMLSGKAMDDNFVRMFEREVETLARLTHPHIGGIYESGRTEDGQYYFAMEIVKGKTLNEYLRDSVSFMKLTSSDVRTRLMLFHKIVNAIHYAHQRGVIHRDLKPSNIIVSDELTSVSGSRSEVPEIKVLDFGLARITDTDIQMTQVTEIGVIKGTLAYMSPEQARGNPSDIDVRSDVYSLGVILYFMLSGKLPKEIPGSMLEAVRVITETNAKPLEEMFRGKKRLDPDIATICHKGLELEADDRYGSASAMAEDIERYLTNQPIQARPPSTVYQLKKMITRNKLTTAFVATVFFMLIGLAVTMTVMQAETETARAEAEKRADELEIVTDFQSSMLSDLDAEAMGLALYHDLAEQVKESLEGDSLSATKIEKTLNNLNNILSRTNATNIALSLIDEQILQRAVETIEEEFVDQPLIRASLQQTVADTYRALGFFQKSLSLQESALNTRRTLLGNLNEFTLTSINNMGLLLSNFNKYEEALLYYKECLSGRRSILGDDHFETLSSIANMGLLLQKMGKLDEAISFTQEALDGHIRVLGKEHEMTLISINNMGLLLHHMQKLDKALPYYKESLEIQRKVLGNDDYSTIISISNMAMLLQEMGKLDEALIYMEEAVATSRRILGDDHSTTNSINSNLGVIFYYMKKYDEALICFQEGLESNRRVLGENHPNTLSSISYVGSLLKVLGKNDEALLYYNTALNGQRKNLGNDHPQTLNSIVKIGALLKEMDRLDDALVYSKEAVDGFSRVLGDEHLFTLDAKNKLGFLYLKRKEPENVISLFKPYESNANEFFKEVNNKHFALYLRALGKARTELDFYIEAENNLLKAYKISIGLENKDFKLKEISSLITLYEKWSFAEPNQGYDQKATEWQTKLAELQAENVR